MSGSPKNWLSKKQSKFLARKFNRPAKFPFGAGTGTLGLSVFGCECTVILIYLWESLLTMNHNFKEFWVCGGSMPEWFTAFWDHWLIDMMYRPSIMSFAQSPLFYLIFEIEIKVSEENRFCSGHWWQTASHLGGGVPIRRYHLNPTVQANRVKTMPSICIAKNCRYPWPCNEISVRLMVIWHSNRAWYEPTVGAWYSLVLLTG